MKTQLLLAALASSVLTLLVMLLVHRNDTRMMINGPVYAGLRQNADLVADILPPPAYALEAYLVCYELLNERDAARRGALVERGKSLTAEYDRRIAHWAGVLDDDVARDALLGRAQVSAREMFAVRDRELIPALDRGDTVMAQASLLHIRDAYQRHRKAIDDVVQRAQAITARDEARAQDQLATSTVVTYVAMLLGLLAPLSLLGLCARRIAGRLARAVGELRERGAALRAASSQVAEASEHLTRGVETQARSVEETVAALEEISTMSMRNAQDASMATERTTVAATAAEGSVTRVDELVAAMEAIRTNARGIAAVIRTIDEIAFQTNMLSLNAAVEAARAGEAGLGFAIVADEVRKLADRSGHAARETTEMIDEANRRSERGTVLMAGVRESLASVTSSSARLLEVSRQIHSASQEQARGVSATNMAMHRMDSVIEENARLAQQVSSSSVGLAEHAGQLAAIAAQLDALVHGERAVASPSQEPSSSESLRAPPPSEARRFRAERDAA